MIIAVLLATSAVAFAQPADTEPTKDYLHAGIAAGIVSASSTNSHAMYGALMVEGGHRILHNWLWMHGQGAVGALQNIDESAGSPASYLEGRVGLEARSCAPDELCVSAGVDVAVRGEHFMAVYDHFDSTTVALVPRLALDLGGDHFRVRPAFELALGSDGNGGGFSIVAGYDW
jgi:hypothetical protein